MYSQNQLMFQWLSPSFPTGSFNFSQGLEYAVSQSIVKNPNDLVEWIENNLEYGYLRNDAIFLNLAFHIRTKDDLEDLTQLCLAFSCSALKLNEQVLMGDNFAKASDTQLGLPYPIALGTAAKKHKLKIEDLVPLFLQSNISNLIAAAQRLLPLGHKKSTNILKDLFEKINEISKIHNVKKGILMKSLRVAFFGCLSGPDLIQSWELLSESKSDISRIKRCLITN